MVLGPGLSLARDLSDVSQPVQGVAPGPWWTQLVFAESIRPLGRELTNETFAGVFTYRRGDDCLDVEIDYG